MNKSVYSPMAYGNGAYIVHKLLEKHIFDYEVKDYNPWMTLCPPALLGYRDSKAQLVHTTPDYAPFLAYKQQRLLITFHNYVLDEYMMKFSTFLQRIHYSTGLKLFIKNAINRAERITSVSKFTADLVRKDLAYKGNIHVIYNGVDESRFTPPETRVVRKKIRVLFSGNPSKRKGFDLLPQLVPLLSNNIELLYTSGLRKSHKGRQITGLENIGAIPYEDMPDLYKSCDILLFPSMREGLSLAALEAMSCGLPLVAANSSSFPEIIDEKKGGYLCEVGNEHAFAKYINILASEKKLREEMGAYNRNKVEVNFTLTRMVSEYNKLFAEMLS